MRIKMKHIFIGLFMIVAFTQGCVNELDQEPDPAEEKEILLQRVNEFNNAFRDGEVEKLEGMITDNYVHTNGNSKAIKKSDWLSYLEKRKEELSNGSLIVRHYEMNETEVEIYDDVALVTAKISFTSIRSGEQTENEYRITNIWIKEKGIWKRAGFHDTRIT